MNEAYLDWRCVQVSYLSNEKYGSWLGIQRGIATLLWAGRGQEGDVLMNRLRLGIPNWEERTQHQRFAEWAKTHGYPFGLAKSQHRVRDRLVTELHLRVVTQSEWERVTFAEVHEAVAWALDAERFLGSFI